MPHLNQIKSVMSALINFSNDEWEVYSKLFRVEHFKKKDLILNQGTIPKGIYFINKGITRAFYTDRNSEEKTFHFGIENTFVTEYKSLLQQMPATFSIQAMEDTEVVIMSYDQVHYGYNFLQFGDRLGRLLAEHYFFIFNDKIADVYTKTPLERYDKLKVELPSVFKRIPQHYIASYLNITPVHLSRLKNGER